MYRLSAVKDPSKQQLNLATESASLLILPFSGPWTKAKDRQRVPNHISCFCRDALADMYYIYHTYLITGKDANLNGPYLSLEITTKRICEREDADVQNIAERRIWQWDGPEITRIYPPDREVELLKPDARGFRNVPYTVVLTYRDSSGQTIDVKTFHAVEQLPPNFKSLRCPPGAVCPK